jgi:hypothetical protein
MKPTKEVASLLKILSVYDDFHHIGQELAVMMNTNQEENFRRLVVGHNTVKVILND